MQSRSSLLNRGRAIEPSTAVSRPALPAPAASLAAPNQQLGHVNPPSWNFTSIPVSRTADLEGEGEGPDTDLLQDEDAGVAAPPTPAPAPAPAPAAPPTPAPVPTAPTLAPTTPAGVTATVPSHIQAASSPAGMPDRIPPRVDSPFAVTVAGWHPPYLPVDVSVQGGGGGNGTVTVDGGTSASLVANATVNLRGGDQTDPGKAGNLRLVAKLGPTVLASSQPFSVSSIPQNWSTSFVSLITGARRGIRVSNSWESDSTNLADLDQAERSEQVEYDAGSGCLAGAGAGAHNSSYLPANSPPLTDSHGVSAASLTSAGGLHAEQVFTLKDKRTGANNIAARNSGFRISRDVAAAGAGFQITTSKIGTRTTAKGYSSNAGAGSVSKTQAV